MRAYERPRISRNRGKPDENIDDWWNGINGNCREPWKNDEEGKNAMDHAKNETYESKK